MTSPGEPIRRSARDLVDPARPRVLEHVDLARTVLREGADREAGGRDLRRGQVAVVVADAPNATAAVVAEQVHPAEVRRGTAVDESAGDGAAKVVPVLEDRQ